MNNRTLLAVAVGVAFLPAGPARALPTGENVVNGNVIVSRPSAQSMQINQATQKGIVNWQGFSIGAAEHVNITQPGASSVLLNRVVGNSASEIFGRLTANGQVFLTNPNGVLFAPGASVEVGSLFATSLSITDQDFLAGRYQFFNPGNAGAIVNQGQIVTANGYTALVGPQVRNDGIIVARLGSVALAAGDRVSLDLVGDGLINISVDQATLNASVVNTGTIAADGGRIILAARSANALLDSVINNTGVLRADSLVERNGEIILDAGAGSVSVSGTDAITATGGSIDVTAGGSLDVSGSGAVVATSGSITLGSGSLTLNGDGTVAAPGGSIAIGSSGNVTLSGSTSINASGAAVQVAGSSMTVGGNTTVLLTAGSGAPLPISEEELKLRAVANMNVTGSTIGQMIRNAAHEAHALSNVQIPDYRTANVLNGPIGVVAPMPHSIVGTGVTLPADAFLTGLR